MTKNQTTGLMIGVIAMIVFIGFGGIKDMNTKTINSSASAISTSILEESITQTENLVTYQPDVSKGGNPSPASTCGSIKGVSVISIPQGNPVANFSTVDVLKFRVENTSTCTVSINKFTFDVASYTGGYSFNNLVLFNASGTSIVASDAHGEMNYEKHQYVYTLNQQNGIQFTPGQSKDFILKAYVRNILSTNEPDSFAVGIYSIAGYDVATGGIVGGGIMYSLPRFGKIITVLP